MTISEVLLEVNPVANTADFVIGLEESDDLENFAPIIANPAKISVDAEGKIRYEVDTSSDKKFIRAGVSD